MMQAVMKGLLLPKKTASRVIGRRFDGRFEDLLSAPGGIELGLFLRGPRLSARVSQGGVILAPVL